MVKKVSDNLLGKNLSLEAAQALREWYMKKPLSERTEYQEYEHGIVKTVYGTRIRARGPRQTPEVLDYYKNSGRFNADASGAANQDLPVKFGTHFSVYKSGRHTYIDKDKIPTLTDKVESSWWDEVSDSTWFSPLEFAKKIWGRK